MQNGLPADHTRLKKKMGEEKRRCQKFDRASGWWLSTPTKSSFHIE
jgi:hypothetical protein